MNAEQVYRASPGWLQTVLLNVHAWQIERHRYGRPFRAAVDALRAQERWPREKLREYQDARLRVVVQTAYDHSPYYRRVFDRLRLRPSDIRTVADLVKLPLLTKQDVRDHGADLMTSRTPRPGWLHGHTSGTTGSPLGLWYDRETCILNNAVDRQHKIWAGMRGGDWAGMFLGRVVVPLKATRPPFWRANAVQRQVWFSSFHMSEDNLEAYVEEIRRRSLRALEGYPSTLFILARYLLRTGQRLPMRAVLSSSETLHAAQRESIEAAFECPLSDFYGLAERVLFACECEAHDGKHLAESYGVTEVVDDEGRPVPAGEPGYLVGTSLHNLAFPMLRYRTSDVSALRVEPCQCGRTSHRIRDVTTKAEDIIVTPDGRLISPSILTHPFKPLDQIAESQIVQPALDRLEVSIVPTAEFTPAHRASLIGALRDRVGPGMTITVTEVDHIPRERSGKFRWVISRVPHPCSISWIPEAATAGPTASGSTTAGHHA